MKTVNLNDPDLKHLEMFRIALSEHSMELRLRAIRNVKHDVISGRLERLFGSIGKEGISDPENALFIQWVAITSSKRNDAAYEFSETAKRFEAKLQTRLNIAEEAGTIIFSSIKDRKFKG